MQTMNISIITTAALPWLTGTSINPLLRAAYLSKDYTVEIVFPECLNATQICQSELLKQDDIIRISYDYLSNSLSNASWCRDNLTINFYPTLYQPISNSLYPHESITNYPFAGDILILEDPIQLMANPSMMPDLGSLLQPPLKQKHKLVIGVNHTNVFFFISAVTSNYFQQKVWRYGLEFFAKLLFNYHCDLTINLSPVLPALHEKSYTRNVNGVHEKFFKAGQTKELAGNYYIGKFASTKNAHLLPQWAVNYQIPIHVYGRVVDFSNKLPYSLRQKYTTQLNQALENCRSPYVAWHDRTLQPEIDLARYKTFINPSLSEVLCTATAEALAMGKFAVLPDHPSNLFFKQFKNALFYQEESEAIQLIRKTASLVPAYDPALLHLSWVQANKRLLSIMADNL